MVLPSANIHLVEGTQSPEWEAGTEQDPLTNREDPSKQLADASQCCHLFWSEIAGSPNSPCLNKVAGRAWSFPNTGRKVALYHAYVVDVAINIL